MKMMEDRASPPSIKINKAMVGRGGPGRVGFQGGRVGGQFNQYSSGPSNQ